jgi:dTDP-3,4-didehydro-2,6-dideoxy-alpha-D-glucose 3-reductase
MGCADVAWRVMFPAMAESESVRGVAVASRDPGKAARFAERFSCSAVVGYEVLLERDDVEAVYIPLPTGLHKEWVTRALTAGKHVLAEKSLTMDYQSAQSMCGLAEERGVLLMENFMFPHHAQHQQVNDLISSGSIGEIRMLRSTFGFPPLPADNFRYSRQLGGGALLDAGAYVVKASTLFLGSDLSLLGAHLKMDSRSGVEVRGSAMLKNGLGQVAQIAFGFDHYYQCRYELLGTAGRLVVERAFTAPPHLRPTIRLQQQGHEQTFAARADNQAANMLSYFAATIAAKGDFAEHRREILEQARLLDMVRKEATVD